MNKNLSGIAIYFILLGATVSYAGTPARTWVDSVAAYGIRSCLPPERFRWDWNQAVLLNSIVHMYRAGAGESDACFDYIRECMDRTADKASGRHPNVCAPPHGMAFLYGETGDEAYLEKAAKVWREYLLIPRAPNYGASHRDNTVELWDDTVYMLGMFFLEMYRQTGDRRYVLEAMDQYRAHAEKLADRETGLWVHGWDADDEDYDDRCCQPGWADPVTRRSREMWGRGNGWILMTLADVLRTIPRSDPLWKEAARELGKMSKNLPGWQDGRTGMWYQLPARAGQEGNYLEGSCTAMFGYALSIGVDEGVLKRSVYGPVAERAYHGLRRHAMGEAGEGQLSPAKVCIGTCIGDKDYYFSRPVASGIDFAVGVYVMFGLEYERSNGLR